MEDSLHADLPRGRSDNRPGVSPDSAFIPTSELAASQDLRFGPGKHFLGIVNGTVLEAEYEGRRDVFCTGGTPIGIHDDRHFMLICGTRGGKSRAAIVPVLLTYGGSDVDSGSVLAVDPKGELANLTAKRRHEMGQQIHILDPYGITDEALKEHRAVFNPMAMIEDPISETRVEDAGLIADAIVVREEQGRDPHWDESARMLLETLILHVATAPQYEGRRDLVTVFKILAVMNDSIREEMELNSAGDFAVEEGAHAFFDRPDKERDSVLSSARRHARFLGYPQMRSVLCGKSIDLHELKTRKTTIYLCLPAMRLGTCSRWLRMFVNATLAALEQETTKPKLPVLLCLDEFAVMGRLQKIEEAAAALAGFSVRLWVILQDLTQLQALYKERWETFLGNAGVIQCFGNSDLTTLKWISERLGQAMVRTETEEPVPYHLRVEQGTTGIKVSMNVQALMTPEEVSRFFGRDDPLLRQLIIMPGRAPIILQRAFHDKHELFKPAPAPKKGLASFPNR